MMRFSSTWNLMVGSLAVLVFFTIVVPVTAPAARAAELGIAAAADLHFAIEDIIAEFEAETGHNVKLSLGSSGNFMTQILHGAPFDLYFSADIGFPRRVQEAGLTVGDPFPYAVGRIVVWVPNDSPLDVQSLGIEALLDPAVRRVAIANPEHAPYGQAAVAALRHYQLYDQVRDRFVLGENIAQTAQFVESGNADIGIIALALAVAPAMERSGRYWEIPLDAFPRMLQGGVILKNTERHGVLDAARQFVHWITSPPGQAVLKRYGFYMPEGE